MDKMLYMMITGSFLIIAIMCFRHFFQNQVPKRFMVFLWIFAIARLLLPISIPVRLPAATYWNITETSCQQHISNSNSYNKLIDGHTICNSPANAGKAVKPAPETVFLLKNILFTLWLAAAVFLATRICIKHIRSCRLYNMSLPFCEERAAKWLQSHHSFRKVDLRKSELIKSPMTYGIIHPVILLPSGTDLDEEEFLCIMEHEWIHIRRWDVLVKYLLYLTVCIYWFNPLVWIMAVLMDRDIEMACDEEVIKKYPGSFKKTYALILIRMAENRQNSARPVNACFSRHSEIEERILSIMKIKKYSWKAVALATGMVCCTITAFTVSAQGTPEKININTAETQIEETETTDKQTMTDKTEDQQTIINTKTTEKNKTGAGQIVKIAQKYIGNPYKPGGTDLTTGVDSIGFVNAIYELAGIKLPADINELAANGTEIPLTELSAGDIIIYSGTGLEDKLSHAAIYDGNGQVIHASNMREGIKISDLNYREICMAIKILK